MRNEVERFDSPEQETFLNLWRTYDCLKAVEEALFSEFDLSPQQYNTLRILEAVSPDGLQTMEIGRRLISRCPDTTRLLDRLESRELISRSRLPTNRRVVEVSIAKPGQALLKTIANQVIDMHSRQVGHLTKNEQRQLIRLLKKARHPHDHLS